MKKNTLAHFITLFLTATPVWTTASATAAERYDFEALGEYTYLGGQDNWIDQAGQGNAIVRPDRTGNWTKVASHLSTVAFDESAFVTRVNNTIFNFKPFSGTETNAVIEFETNGEAVSWFGLGHDINGNGILDVAWNGKSLIGELGPVFGVDHIAIIAPRYFVLQSCDGILHKTEFGNGDNGADVYLLRLRIDFAANNGDGAGSVYYKNLTDGDLSFLPINGLQNVDLKLTMMDAAAGPRDWDAMWLHLRTVGDGSPFADNLAPNLSFEDACADAIDNDGDGMIDCNDADCGNDPECSGGTNCAAYGSKSPCNADPLCMWSGKGKSAVCVPLP